MSGYKRNDGRFSTVGKWLIVCLCSFGLMGFWNGVSAQDTSETSGEVPYYVDDDGLLKDSDTGEEAAFFGVNYSTPFAHSYRALKQLGKDHKQEIDKDVYHFARMGMNAFRIHVWDTEISDSLGNLKQNEHLDLLDYMLWKLEERNIKVILTPLTFYDNAYPDGATPTPGFANYISKGEAPQNPDFMPVMKRYLDQFHNHVNPYTGKSYSEDPNIIATEIINEPSHGGDIEPITDFINELADHVRETGWEKPVFYNIAQNPGVTEAVMQADVDGLSFQWYPAGLVGGDAIERNYMPFVNEYPIPFRDGEGFSEKAMMVYEFDAADNSHTYSYPLMARSFREAGFQWATQFAYDPIAIAPYNSDYPTHYLNLAYTPKRALSMLIASEVFRQTPHRQSFDDYPADTLFGDFRVSHSKNLSELNDGEKFYYTNDTDTEPAAESSLRHIAGAGSSPVIQYEGTGAYFLDKLEDGAWRLEVYPDAIPVSNPFDNPSFSKEVTHIMWGERSMTVNLPDLGNDFDISGLNNANDLNQTAQDGQFDISPGSYLLTLPSKNSFQPDEERTVGEQNVGLEEFYAPEPNSYEKPQVVHSPDNYLTAGTSALIKATVVGLAEEEVRVIVSPYDRQGRDIPMKKVSPAVYEAEIPADYLQTGTLNYWITTGEEEDQITFPGGHEGYPWAWDYYHDDVWSVPVIPENEPIRLFSAFDDTDDLEFAFSPWSDDYQRSIKFFDGKPAIQVYADSLTENRRGVPGWSFFVGDIIKSKEKSTFSSISLDPAGVVESSQTLKVVLIDYLGIPYSTNIELNETREMITLNQQDFQPDKNALLPRPYPTFLPYWFEPEMDHSLNMNRLENIQLLLLPDDNPGLINQAAGFDLSQIWLNP